MSCKTLKEMPLCMAERAVLARKLAGSNPGGVQFDENFLPWSFDESSGRWLSFDGNYSASSPMEKLERQQARQEEWDRRHAATAESYAKDIVYQSDLRLRVLERDGYSCQLCGLVGNSRLHVHHILKRSEGGTDHFDNLLTVCPSCHKRADTKLYNPAWVSREEVA